VCQAEQRFNRVPAYRYLPMLARALRHHTAKIAQTEKAA